jgi:biopolymer transport protein ExbD
MQIPSPVIRRRPRIEVVPLIDIVFFLLATFVMVSMSMVKNRGIAVRLPSAATGAARDQRAIATVSLSTDGAVYLDRQQLTLGELTARLSGLKIADERLRVVIHGDESVPFGRAIQILDEVRRAGITEVSIQTRPAAVSQEPP